MSEHETLDVDDMELFVMKQRPACKGWFSMRLDRPRDLGMG